MESESSSQVQLIRPQFSFLYFFSIFIFEGLGILIFTLVYNNNMPEFPTFLFIVEIASFLVGSYQILIFFVPIVYYQLDSSGITVNSLFSRLHFSWDSILYFDWEETGGEFEYGILIIVWESQHGLKRTMLHSLGYESRELLGLLVDGRLFLQSNVERVISLECSAASFLPSQGKHVGLSE